MLPFRWFSARHALQELMGNPEYGTEAGTALELNQALENAMSISMDCLPRWPGRTAIACDLSGSMSNCPISQYSSIYPIDIACILSAAAYHLCEDPILYAFGSELARFNLDPTKGALANAEIVKKTDVGHATYGYKVIEDLVKHRDSVSRIVILTDMELYDESSFLRDSQDIRAWFIRYRRELNGDAELYFVNLAAYGHFVTPQCEPKVTYISGWSEGILKYVASTSAGFDLVNEISNISL